MVGAMSLIGPDDPDFRVCRVDFGTLLDLQIHAERQGWGTRWSSVDALRGQVRDEPVLLQSFLRQERGGAVSTFRCLVLFSVVEGDGAGGVTTLDVDPALLASLEPADLDPNSRAVFADLFAKAVNGISMITKA